MDCTSWSCSKKDSSIEVSREGKFVGNSVLLKQPYCEICFAPDTPTHLCTNPHELYSFNSVHAVGAYVKKQFNKGDLLSNHIVELKSFIDFAAPLGLAMGIVAKDRFPALPRG